MRKPGMSEQIYFFDTYAFFEIIRGSFSYEKYKDAHAITTVFNMAELNYNLKKEVGSKIADKYTDMFKDFVMEVTLEDIKKAISLKVKKKHLSIPDAVGYVISQKYKVKFLTGDSDFEGMPNVEYVK